MRITDDLLDQLRRDPRIGGKANAGHVLAAAEIGAASAQAEIERLRTEVAELRSIQLPAQAAEACARIADEVEAEMMPCREAVGARMVATRIRERGDL